MDPVAHPFPIPMVDPQAKAGRVPVKAIRDGQYLIGNNRGGVNGWITADSIHGRLIAVET